MGDGARVEQMMCSESLEKLGLSYIHVGVTICIKALERDERRSSDTTLTAKLR